MSENSKYEGRTVYSASISIKPPKNKDMFIVLGKTFILDEGESEVLQEMDVHRIFFLSFHRPS